MDNGLQFLWAGQLPNIFANWGKDSRFYEDYDQHKGFHVRDHFGSIQYFVSVSDFNTIIQYSSLHGLSLFRRTN